MMVEWLDSNRDWVIFKNPKVAFTRRRVTWSLKNIFECLSHRDRSIHIERECLAVFTFAKGSFTLVAGRCDCRRGLGRCRSLRKFGKFSILQPSIAGRSRFAV